MTTPDQKTTVPVLLDLAERLIERLRADSGSGAWKLAEEATMYASLFDRWLVDPPTEEQHAIAARRFLRVHHHAAEYLLLPRDRATKPPDLSPTERPPPATIRERIAGAAVEVLDADPSVRGVLTEADCAPLMEWARDRTLAAAANVGRRIEAPEAVARVASLLGAVVRAAAEAAASGSAAALAPTIEQCPRAVIERELAVELVGRARLDGDAGANAERIAAALRAATPLDPS